MGPGVVGTAAASMGLPYPMHVQATLGEAVQAATGPATGQPGASNAADPWATGVGDPWNTYNGGAPPNMGRTQYANISTPPGGAQQLPPPAAAIPGVGPPAREYDHKRPVFDEKVAMDAHHRYDDKRQEEWLKTTKNY